MPMDPTQLSQSIVRLFGWVVGSVSWREPAAASSKAAQVAGAATAAAPPKGATKVTGAATAAAPLVNPQGKGLADAKLLAQILAFTNEGRYTPFRTPALFLVRDEGNSVYENGAVDPEKLGLAYLDQSMVFSRNLKFWICDRSAYITRLDVSIGTLQRTAIDLETGGAQGRRIDLVGQESSFTARLGQGPY
jgi:hypothetical protein